MTTRSISPKKKKSVGIFQEDNGNYSYMRLASTLCLITAMFIALYSLHTSFETGIQYCIPFVVYGFFPKSLQKFAEENVTKPDQLNGRSQNGIFNEDNGNLSFLRFGAFASLLFAIALAALSIINQWENGLEYILLFLSGSFGSKYIQKMAEQNMTGEKSAFRKYFLERETPHDYQNNYSQDYSPNYPDPYPQDYSSNTITTTRPQDLPTIAQNPQAANEYWDDSYSKK